MGIITGYDKNLNPVDSTGDSYDRSTGAWLGKVDGGELAGSRFLGKLALICFGIYILPGYFNSFLTQHPGLRFFTLIITMLLKLFIPILIGIILFMKIKKFLRGRRPYIKKRIF